MALHAHNLFEDIDLRDTRLDLEYAMNLGRPTERLATEPKRRRPACFIYAGVSHGADEDTVIGFHSNAELTAWLKMQLEHCEQFDARLAEMNA